MNLASRLAGLCGMYGVGVICSEVTHRGLPESVFCRRLDLVKVKGRLEPTTIYEVIGQEMREPTDSPAPAVQEPAQRVHTFDEEYFERSLSSDVGMSSDLPGGALPFNRALPSTGEAVNIAMRKSTQALKRGGSSGAGAVFPQLLASMRVAAAARGAARQTPRPSPAPPLAHCAPSSSALSLCGNLEERIIDETRAHVRKYEDALSAWQRADFREAHRLAKELLVARPEDLAAMTLYRRCAAYLGPDGSVAGLTEEELASWTGCRDMVNK
mmetsp:Transcript_67672/g.195598  ORF Transcript_67672/g.195598 Transcript_67672/m.195598 type:complete len:270 (-) Transcript_67672:8-817(-)